MKTRMHRFLGRFEDSAIIVAWPAVALVFTLAVVPVVAHAQTTGPIKPNPSNTPQQEPHEDKAQASTSGQSGRTTLAGVWRLNRDQSDDPRQKLEQASSGGGGGWGRGPAGGGGWGGWGGGGWGVPGSGRGGRNRSGGPIPEGGAVDMSDFSQLTIEQSDSSAKVTGATGRILAQYNAEAAGEKNSKDAKSKNGSYTPPAAQWQGDELVTTGNGPRGAKTTRIYELSSNGKQLYVTTRLESPRFDQPVSIRFVYDPARAAEN